MSLALVLVLLAVSLALAAALLRASANLRTLRTELHAAHQSQGTRDSHRIDLDTVRNEFVANVSHELRTPLTSIRGALGLISSGLLAPVHPRAQSLLHIALANTDRLIRLSNDLLDLDRISCGHATLQLRRCSMRELAQQAIETMTPQADDARIRLHLVLDAPPDSLFFDGDCDRILQVLTNLLSNAIKFSPPSSIVEIRIDAEPDTLRLRVSDSGRGIPPDKLASIFGRFEQVETADAHEKGGAGLGLAICRTIMQQHDGAIWAESNPQQNRGPGASLFITLPRAARQQDALPALTSPASGTILLCDPDPASAPLSPPPSDATATASSKPPPSIEPSRWPPPSPLTPSSSTSPCRDARTPPSSTGSGANPPSPPYPSSSTPYQTNTPVLHLRQPHRLRWDSQLPPATSSPTK